MNYGANKAVQRSRDQQAIYAFAHVECWIEEYAKSTNQSPTELCARVATLLLAQGNGTGYNLPEVQGDTARVGQSVVPVEMVEHSPSRVHDRPTVRYNKDGSIRKAVKWTPAKRKAASLRMRKIQGRLQEARRAKALKAA